MLIHQSMWEDGDKRRNKDYAVILSLWNTRTFLVYKKETLNTLHTG